MGKKHWKQALRHLNKGKHAQKMHKMRRKKDFCHRESGRRSTSWKFPFFYFVWTVADVKSVAIFFYCSLNCVSQWCQPLTELSLHFWVDQQNTLCNDFWTFTQMVAMNKLTIFSSRKMGNRILCVRKNNGTSHRKNSLFFFSLCVSLSFSTFSFFVPQTFSFASLDFCSQQLEWKEAEFAC